MNDTLLVAVSRLIGLPESTIQDWTRDAPRSYKRYTVPKRSGGERIIFHPSKTTKSLQYAILSIIEQDLCDKRVHACAMAYRRGFSSPLKVNANIHCQNQYLLRADLQDFFPTLSTRMVIKSLPWNISNDDQNFLIRCCFVKNTRGFLGLPIGAPSSPLLSNCAMFDFDIKASELATTMKGAYSRYADDMVFSTNSAEARGEWLSGVGEILNELSNGELKINNKKTTLGSRASRRSVTGIIITPDGQISIGRERKRMIRSMIHKAAISSIEQEQVERLRGLLAFASDIEPKFLERMISRYGDIVLSIRRGKYLAA